MSRPHVLITYPFPLGMKNGGARMTREIARHLGRAGARATVLPLSATPMTMFPRPRVADALLGLEFDAPLAQDSVAIVRVAQHPLHWMLDSRAVRAAVKTIVERERVDLVLGYYNEAAALPSLLRGRGIAFGYISTWQSYARALKAKATGVRGLPRRWWNHRSVVQPYRSADVFFATSQFTRRELIDVVGVDASRIVLCPLGVDPSFLAVPRARPRSVEHLLFFGRLTHAKGIFDAIEALGRLARQGRRGWTLRVLGSGDRAAVQRAAQRAGVAERVEIADAVGDEELRAALAWAHVAVLPSRFEAFGLAFAEAQAAGLPVIGFAAGSVPEVVEHGVSGWLGPARDIDRLAENLQYAMDDPGAVYAAGTAGRERVGRTFRWETTAATILAAVAPPSRTAAAAASVTAAPGGGSR